MRDLLNIMESWGYGKSDPKPNRKVVAKFADVDPKHRSYYIQKWAEEKGIDSDDAMFMAGYVQDGYIGAGAWNWRYVGMDSDPHDMFDSFDPRGEPTRQQEYMQAYTTGGEQALAQALGMSEQELDQEINDCASEHGLHADDDRDECIGIVVDELVSNADFDNYESVDENDIRVIDLNDLLKRAGLPPKDMDMETEPEHDHDDECHCDDEHDDNTDLSYSTDKDMLLGMIKKRLAQKLS